MTLKQLLIPGIACVLFAAAGCGSNTSSTSTTTTTQDSAGSKMDQAKGSVEQGAADAGASVKEAMAANPDSSFAAEVTVANNEEINLLQAGIDKGTSKELKSHARMMLNDHKGLKTKMEAWAAKKNYTMPADDQGKAQKALDDMSSHTGNDWDKAWADMMFDAHEKTIGKFDGAKSHLNDPDLKLLVDNTLPTLHSHLEMVRGLQAKLK